MGESSSAKDGSISEFIVRYRSYVYASALKILKDTYRAEDCTQMTFEQVCRHTEKIYSMDEQGVRSYLYRMIHNCAMDIFRKETRSVAMDREKLEMHINRQQIDEILAESDWSDRFEELFSNLTTEEVYLVIRRHKERMTYAEIAAELGLSEEACKKRGQRLKQKIANLLSQEEGESADE